MPKKKNKISLGSRGNPISRGRVVAMDIKYTGEEPTWDDMDTITDEQFLSRRAAMLQFYNYYLNHKYLMPDAFQWMKGNGYDKNDISKIRSLPDNAISFTNKKLMRAMNMGMPGKHKSYIQKYESSPDVETIRSAVSKALSMADVEEELPDELKPVKISPFQLSLDKTNREVISRLDEMLDSWILSGDQKVKGLALLALLSSSNVKGAPLQTVVDWVERQLNELNGAYNKTDEQAVEGYSYLSRASMKSRISELNKMLADCDKRKNMSKVERKSRKKTVPNISKQTENMKYMKQDMELGVSSLSPTTIPGKRNVILYHAKNRALDYLVASSVDGFIIKGTTIKNIDVDKSYSRKIRKPKDIITELQKATPSKSDKLLETLTTKPSKANGRTNDSTIILKSW